MSSLILCQSKYVMSMVFHELKPPGFRSDGFPVDPEIFIDCLQLISPFQNIPGVVIETSREYVNSAQPPPPFILFIVGGNICGSTNLNGKLFF